MKKKYLYVLSTALALFIAQDAFTSSGGSPSGNSGSPASNGNTCARSGCHSTGTAAGQTISITTDIPAGGFMEDSIYSITVTANNGGASSDRMGFMASVESPSGHTGNLQITDAARTKKAGSYVTHTFSGIAGSNGENIWNFDWDAQQSPDQSTVYVAVNFSNNNGTTSGDVILTESLVLSKGSGIGLQELKRESMSAYPNPAVDQLVVAGEEFIAPYVVLNAAGMRVKELKLVNREGQHWYFNVSDLKTGVYLIQDSEGRGIRFTKN